MTIKQKRRELFEAWYAKRYGIRENSTWAHAEFCDAWEAWCAALDAVVIALPDAPNPDASGGREDYQLDTERLHAIRQCRAAIESTGLGLRVKS